MPAEFPTQPEELAQPLLEEVTQAVPQDAPTETTGPISILDWIVDSEHVAEAGQASHRWDEFMTATTIYERLLAWLGKVDGLSKKSLVRRLNADVAQIDQWLNDQLNAILHHPKFQKLEASWRGLQYLTDMVDEEADRQQVHVRVLNASWKDVERDMERAIEFDASELFKKIYEEEFGTAGGKPFGVMIGDYHIHPQPTKHHPHRDIDTLQGLAGIAAASFCPFIAGASSSMFGLDDFSGIEHVENLRSGFDQAEFTQWHAFRKSEDARFVGLVMPKVLMRLPYETFDARADGFCFREEVAGRDRRNYLWGNAAYAFAEVLIRAYSDCGWLAQIRGVQRNVVGGGLVSRLPVHYFGTDREGIAPKASTDCIVSDRQEAELANLGFIPLTHCHDTELSAFYSNQTVQLPKRYEEPEATQNAKISSMLQYILCTSQFAHALKVIARDKVGTFESREAIERFLNDWIHDYVTPDQKAKPETKAARPLRQAEISLRDDPGKPGSYHCTFKLWPHYQLDDLVASIRMKTTIEGRRQ
ncbi:type VI secretion system contractile sheath large subunit [Bremerella sp. JC817]|uniref:type VI secretion system contractile sheath large subunit n=1 Tax=Bremerella sp. JC817 TaxID=3231756 RepID=UPI00345B4786